MRWRGQRESENVEDRRRMSPGLAIGGGLGLVVALVAVLLGGDPSKLLEAISGAAGNQPGQERELTPEEIEKGKFVKTVLASTEDVWTADFQRLGRTYEKPVLVMFSGQVQSACGMATAAVGPFYCPEDNKLYIDLSFYQELEQRFGAPGEFAQAYVIAHEVGHHIQNLLGAMAKAQQMRQQMSEKESNQVSVRLELQADFYAGVWARKADQMRDILDEKDIEDGLRAASAIGDDRLQQQSQGYVVPDAFTHGTSEQRVRWFRKGWDSGDLRQGDTFSARNL